MILDKGVIDQHVTVINVHYVKQWINYLSDWCGS